MLYNTWRPHQFDDMVGQKAVVENIRSQSKSNRWFGVYAFCGQYGSGKTSMARMLAQAANCKHKDENGNPCCECEECRSIMEGNSPDVIEIAAAVNTGVDKVREICDTVSYHPVSLTKKVYIIDEAQALSKAAFQAFLKMLEEPPQHVIFILATTDMGAIPPTVRSRAAVYYFSQLTQEEISTHLMNVSEREGLSVTSDACDVIAKHSQGSMRNALSLLEMAVQENGIATGATVECLLGVSTPDALFSIIESVLKGMAGDVIRKTTELIEGGADLSVLINDMLGYVADLTVTCVSPNSVRGTEHYLSLLRSTALKGDATRFSSMAEALLDVKNALRKQADSSTLMITLVKMARDGSIVVPDVKVWDDENAVLRSTVASLEERLRVLEKAIAVGGISVDICECERNVVEATVAKMSVDEVSCSASLAEKVEDVIPEMEQELSSEEEYGTEDAVKVDREAGTEISESEMPEAVEKAKEVMSAKSDTSSNGFDENDLFSFLALDDTGSKTRTQREEHYPVLTKLLKEENAFCAALSCCTVKEDSEGAVISTTLPAVEKFLVSCLQAYKVRGMDVTGIKIA